MVGPPRYAEAVEICPSILSADFANLQSALESIRNADWAHVDVMDGHFVPNLTIGTPVVEALAKVSPLPLDCHLMIDDPDRWAPGYVEAGAHRVTFHVEAAADPVATARAIRDLGAKAGITVKPGTPWEHAALLPEVDMVLVMTVEPGFGGQTFQAEMLPKVARVREDIHRSGRPVRVQVDGGVSAETIAECVRAGADSFVAGSAVFRGDAAANVDLLRELATAAA